MGAGRSCRAPQGGGASEDVYDRTLSLMDGQRGRVPTAGRGESRRFEMNKFSEATFMWCLLNRPDDAKIFSTLFNPAWLQSPEYRPILEEIYTFTRKYGLPPNVPTLRKVFQDRDIGIYTSRYGKVLDTIEHIAPKPELPEMVLILEQAREVAMVWSFNELTNSIAFKEVVSDNRGRDQMQLITAWIRQFQSRSEELEMNIKEAVDYLKTQAGWENKSVNIPCGIKVIDRMLGGGLRPKNLGIILAPTGGGKSLTLTIMAKKMSSVEDKNVFFITNELSMEETTERFITSLTSTKLEDLTNDVTREEIDEIPQEAGQKGPQLEKHWRYGLHNRLRIWEVRREISTDEIEAMLAKLSGLYGWRPDVIIIDYMERMRPSVTGVKRDQIKLKRFWHHLVD